MKRSVCAQRSWPLVLCLISAVVCAPAPAADEDQPQLLRQRLEMLQSSPASTVQGASIAAVPLLMEIYARRNFTPTWKPARIDELIEIVEATEAEGLNPEDYHASLLRQRRERADAGAQQRADFDILLTDALIRLGSHLRFGKVDPTRLDPNWNVGRDDVAKDLPAVFQAAIDADSLRAFIDSRIPRQGFYGRLKGALARYRAISDAGGWPEVPEGPALKPGMRDARVPVLRRRLAAEGYLESADGSDDYDASVEQAVTMFQERHGLGADGVAGKQTFAAMNVSVDARIDQIKANLERSRWVFTDLSGDFLVVNIAGYELYLVRDDDIAWSTIVMVGKPYRETPVFKAQLKYLVLNPTWTIPPGILRRDIIPNMRRDPDYLNKKGYLLLDRDGRPVDQSTVDYASLSPGNFPYIVRQPAGADNALGQVKFIFPNSHFVFLHDTNHRELFVQRERAFSSGCIRVKDPLKLAELLLEDKSGWDAPAIDKTLAGGRTTTVHLEQPLPVLLLYWTTAVAEDGSVTFYKDVYGRDAKIIDGLASPFSLAPALAAGQ